jgi:hypothetical protein
VPAPDLPEDVERFLDTHLDAFEQLEVLLFLRRQARAVDLESLAGALGMDREACEEACRHLAKRGVVRATGDPPVFAYAPSRPEDVRTVDALAKLYAEDRVVVIQAITASSLERLRRSTLRAFAEAFRLKERRDDA